MNKIKKEYKLIVPIIILVLIDQLLKFVILKVGNPIYQNTSGTYGVDSNSTFTYIVTNFYKFYYKYSKDYIYFITYNTRYYKY